MRPATSCASPFPATTGWRHARQSGYYVFPQDVSSGSGIKATAAGTILIARGAGLRGAVEEFTEQGNATGRAIDTGRDVWSDIAPNSDANLSQPDGVAVDPGN